MAVLSPLLRQLVNDSPTGESRVQDIVPLCHRLRLLRRPVCRRGFHTSTPAEPRPAMCARPKRLGRRAET